MREMTRRKWFSTLAAAFVLPWLPRPKLAPKSDTLDEIIQVLTDNFFVQSPLCARLYMRNHAHYNGGDCIQTSFAISRPAIEGTAEELTPLIVPYSTIPSLVSPGNGAN